MKKIIVVWLEDVPINLPDLLCCVCGSVLHNVEVYCSRRVTACCTCRRVQTWWTVPSRLAPASVSSRCMSCMSLSTYSIKFGRLIWLRFEWCVAVCCSMCCSVLQCRVRFEWCERCVQRLLFEEWCRPIVVQCHCQVYALCRWERARTHGRESERERKTERVRKRESERKSQKKKERNQERRLSVTGR